MFRITQKFKIKAKYRKNALKREFKTLALHKEISQKKYLKISHNY